MLKASNTDVYSSCPSLHSGQGSRAPNAKQSDAAANSWNVTKNRSSNKWWNTSEKQQQQKGQYFLIIQLTAVLTTYLSKPHFYTHTDMHTQTHTNPCMHTKSSERKIFSLPTYSTKISLTGEYAFHLCNYYNTRSSSKVTACFPGHVSKYGPNTIWICKKTKTTVIFLCLRAVMVVAFSSCARTWGEYLTIYSPPALFF